MNFKYKKPTSARMRTWNSSYVCGALVFSGVEWGRRSVLDADSCGEQSSSMAAAAAEAAAAAVKSAGCGGCSGERRHECWASRTRKLTENTSSTKWSRLDKSPADRPADLLTHFVVSPPSPPSSSLRALPSPAPPSPARHHAGERRPLRDRVTDDPPNRWVPPSACLRRFPSTSSGADIFH